MSPSAERCTSLARANVGRMKRSHKQKLATPLRTEISQCNWQQQHQNKYAHGCDPDAHIFPIAPKSPIHPRHSNAKRLSFEGRGHQNNWCRNDHDQGERNFPDNSPDEKLKQCSQSIGHKMRMTSRCLTSQITDPAPVDVHLKQQRHRGVCASALFGVFFMPDCPPISSARRSRRSRKHDSSIPAVVHRRSGGQMTRS